MTLYNKGSRESDILIVGEAPGATEVEKGLPFVGTSGQELDRMLLEVGLNPPDLRYTNVCHVRPPDNQIENFFPTSKKEALLKKAQYDCGMYYTGEISVGLETLKMEIASMPNLRLIIPVGGTALWAVTGMKGIDNWRGSQMFAKRLSSPIPCVPTYHPARVLRQWDLRWLTVLDMKRAKKWMSTGFEIPPYEFIVKPTFSIVKETLDRFLSRLEAGENIFLSTDIETRSGHIACLGIAWSKLHALCIPFMTMHGAYWSLEEEIHIVWRLFRVTTHVNVRIIGQNFLYDQQYLARRWGFKARLTDDTMVKQHLCFPGIPKALDFISSVYNDHHLYWKNESKDWDPRVGEEQLWIYNCKDACVTFEANFHLDKFVDTFKLRHLLEAQMRDGERALKMMLRGIRVNEERKADIAIACEKQMASLATFAHSCIGMPFDLSSSPQVLKLAYEVLKLPVIKNKVTKRPTADKDAIKEWCEKAEPLFQPLLRAIADYRSLQVYRSTFALSPLDLDRRFRCSISITGTSTFRWSTSADAFGFGTNMQNIPKGNEDD